VLTPTSSTAFFLRCGGRPLSASSSAHKDTGTPEEDDIAARSMVAGATAGGATTPPAATHRAGGGAGGSHRRDAGERGATGAVGVGYRRRVCKKEHETTTPVVRSSGATPPGGSGGKPAELYQEILHREIEVSARSFLVLRACVSGTHSAWGFQCF